MKRMTAEEVQRKIDEDKIAERDWKTLEKAQEYEKTNLKKAIFIYEEFVSIEARYGLPYIRLPIIYRKKKEYNNEVRVLKTAIQVFERDGNIQNLEDAKIRLQKALSLMQKSV